MNDNVGDMPLDIFGDYISDCLGEEWTWEYFIPNLNGSHMCHSIYGCSHYIEESNLTSMYEGDGFAFCYTSCEINSSAIGNGMFQRFGSGDECGEEGWGYGGESNNE